MSRNESRIQPLDLSNTNIETQNNSDQNPFGLSFVVPTEIVDLPTRGLLYGEGSSMNNRGFVEIKHMTSKEEDILVNENYISKGIVIDKLIESLLVDKNIKVKDINTNDKNAIVFAARETGYGPEYVLIETCLGCDKEGNFTYDLGKRRISVNEMQDVASDLDNNLHTFVLPKVELEITIRVLNQGDFDAIDQCKILRKKHNLEFNETVEFLKSTIVEVQGVTDKEAINQLIDVLPAIDSRKIRVTHNKVVPFLNTKQEVVCEYCGQAAEREVPFSLGFFWPDV